MADKQFGLQDADGFLTRPKRYSWEDAVVYPQQQEQVFNEDIVRHAVSALDIIIALLNEEIRKVREYIPRVNVAEFWRVVKTKVPQIKFQSFVDFFKWFSGSNNRMLQGNEVNLDLAKLDSSEDFTNTFSDDDDIDSCRAASTVYSQANDKRISDLEAQLNELKAQLGLLVQQKGGGNGVPATQKPTVSKIPEINKTAPPPPPPPPPSFFKVKPPAPQPAPERKTSSSADEKEKEEPLDENKPPVAQPRAALNFMELGSVKLKKVARTPGGTPIRAFPERADLAGSLAKALKQKFKNAEDSEEHVHTSEDDEWDDELTKPLNLDS